MSTFDTPVLLITFNRPDTTLRILEAIKTVKPKKLFVSSDGPRENRPDDIKRVNEVRTLVSNFIDWDCEILTLYREKNVGCKLGVSGAITWFFDNVEAGIILEDDCLPVTSFFYYCQELLQKYQSNSEVMMISGDFFGKPTTDKNLSSYYFTNHFHIWGWASWRRAWQKYDIKMTHWPETKTSLETKLNFDSRIWESYSNSMQRVFEQKVDTWDFQWVYTCWINNGLAICPTVNLISNIGFGVNATHTFNAESVLSHLPSSDIEIPLKHPTQIKRDFQLEKRSELVAFPTLTTKIKSRITGKIKKLFV